MYSLKYIIPLHLLLLIFSYGRRPDRLSTRSEIHLLHSSRDTHELSASKVEGDDPSLSLCSDDNSSTSYEDVVVHRWFNLQNHHHHHRCNLRDLIRELLGTWRIYQDIYFNQEVVVSYPTKLKFMMRDAQSNENVVVMRFDNSTYRSPFVCYQSGWLQSSKFRFEVTDFPYVVGRDEYGVPVVINSTLLYKGRIDRKVLETSMSMRGKVYLLHGSNL